MKKQFKFLLLTTFLLIALVNISYSAAYVINPTSETETVSNDSKLLKDQLTIDDVLTKNRKGIEKKLGKKLKLKERIALKLMKRKLKRKLRKGKSKADLKKDFARDKSEFNVGAFFLGLLLGLIGVLLAYIFMEKDQAKSAWKGFGVLVILVLLSLIL